MKMRVKRLRHKPRLIGGYGFVPDRDCIRSKRGYYIVWHDVVGHDEHNCWDCWLILRFK